MHPIEAGERPLGEDSHDELHPRLLQSPSTTEDLIDRREFLRLAGAAALVGALEGCTSTNQHPSADADPWRIVVRLGRRPRRPQRAACRPSSRQPRRRSRSHRPRQWPTSTRWRRRLASTPAAGRRRAISTPRMSTRPASTAVRPVAVAQCAIGRRRAEMPRVRPQHRHASRGSRRRSQLRGLLDDVRPCHRRRTDEASHNDRRDNSATSVPAPRLSMSTRAGDSRTEQSLAARARRSASPVRRSAAGSESWRASTA